MPTRATYEYRESALRVFSVDADGTKEGDKGLRLGVFVQPLLGGVLVLAPAFGKALGQAVDAVDGRSTRRAASSRHVAVFSLQPSVQLLAQIGEFLALDPGEQHYEVLHPRGRLRGEVPRHRGR
jgi:hypothetical protein